MVKPWLIWLTASRGEWETYRNLLACGIEAYYPFTLEDSRRERRKHPRDQPLFPGYVFGRSGVSGIDQLIERIPGARSVLRNERTIVQLTTKQFVQIKQRCDEIIDKLQPKPAELRELKVGDVVPIPYGPFIGSPAIIVHLDSEGRIEAQLGQFVVTFRASELISASEKSVAVSRVRLSNTRCQHLD